MNIKNILSSRIGPFLTAVFLLAPSAPAEEWAELDRYQETMSADTFSRLLSSVYAPEGIMIPYLRYGADSVSVYSTPSQTGAPLYVLRFAAEDAEPEPIRPAAGRPLEGIRVALDPGHIGGAWSRMEERFFFIDWQQDWPVQEAAMNLYVARLIRDRLTALGADAVLVKDDFEPLTDARADALMAEQDALPPPDARFAHLPALFVESSQQDARRKNAEREFFRTREIRARADRINHEIRPDITLCIHFNATGYGFEKTLFEKNGLAFFIHGSYMPGEAADDEQKRLMLLKLLGRTHAEELATASALRDAFVDATGIPPAYENYAGPTMKSMGGDYIYARNLAANRLFRGPVVFLEPYFMNNRTVYARIQAGDYEGEREFDGVAMPSIFREYADAVTDGLLRRYAPEYRASAAP